MMHKGKLTGLAILAFVMAAAFRAVELRKAEVPATGRSTIRTRVGVYSRNVVYCGAGPNDQVGVGDIPPLTGWGHYSWLIGSKSDSAQFYFDQGINLYYAFHIIESRASFSKAIRFDSASAMAWWGRAMSLGPTINEGNTYRAANEAWLAAKKCGSLVTSDRAIDQDLAAAVAVKYSPDSTTDLKALALAYASKMDELANRYPGNADILALDADALMLQHPWDLYDSLLQPKAWTPKIRSVLTAALAVNPKHPGANHYFIHTIEGSLHPEDALAAADTLAALMPEVAHIVHMPSHIYIRTGHYARGIAANDHALAGYVKYRAAFAPVEESAPLYQMHALHMKINCAMMAGAYVTARKSADTLQTLIPRELTELESPFGNYMQYLSESAALVAVRFGSWQAILSGPMPDVKQSTPFAAVLIRFARGMALAHTSHLEDARHELELLDKAMTAPVLKIPFDPQGPAIDPSLVARNILAGTIAALSGSNAQARKFFERAVAAEDHIIYNEPRDWPIAARNYLGDFLLRQKTYGAAAMVFKKDLEINPGNGWSLTGLKTAYGKIGRMKAAAIVSRQIETAFAIRDGKIDRAAF